jgi:RNA polymerase sigma-70 factor, ECF subfamily
MSIDEARLRRLVEADRAGEAMQELLEQHGAAFYGYIVGLVGDDALAADAFQLFSLRLWRALPQFQWRSQLKTWAYAIARNAAYRTAQDPYRKRSERLGTVEQEQLSAKWARTSTARWRQTGERQRLWELIEGLPPEDRELLILRLGRKMPWREIAAVLNDGETDPKVLKTKAASARKRFERVKERLKRDLAPFE